MVLRQRIHNTKRWLRLIHPWECLVRVFPGKVVSMQSQRNKSHYLSLGKKTTGTVRRATTEGFETRTAAQFRLLKKPLVVEGLCIRAKYILLEMELAIRHHDLPIYCESFVANDDWSFNIACR